MAHPATTEDAAAAVVGVGVDQDGLVAQARARVRRALGRREALTTTVIATAFLVAVGALLVAEPVDLAGRGDVTVLLTLCYALAARVEFEVGFAFAVPTQLMFVPLLFLAPPAAVPLLVALALVMSKLPEHARGDWHPGRIGLHLGSAWYAVGPVLVLWAAGWPEPTLRGMALLVPLMAAQFAFDFAFSAARAWFALGIPPRELVDAFRPAWLVDLALAPLGFLLAAAALEASYAALLGLPVMGLLAYFARERKARIDNALELSHAYRGTALLLGDMVEADDAYTGLHSQDVVSLVLATADRLGLDGAERRRAELTALLHDVGKVKISNAIINKPGALTAEERAVINTHTIEGERMLEKVGGLLGEIGHLVRSCHERWDGRGYPDGLAGEASPLVARIVCACDAFSAMTTTRSYRPAMSSAEALEELRRCAGTQFDPRVVEALAMVAAVAPVSLADAA